MKRFILACLLAVALPALAMANPDYMGSLTTAEGVTVSVYYESIDQDYFRITLQWPNGYQVHVAVDNELGTKTLIKKLQKIADAQ